MATEAFVQQTSSLVPVRRGELRGQAYAPFASLRIESLPWDTLRQRPVEGFRLEKASHTRRVISFVYGAEGEAPLERPVRLYAKRAQIRGWRKVLGSLFRASKAKREFKLGLGMLERGIPTPVPVFYAERRARGFLRESFVVTLELEGAVPFCEAIKAFAPSPQRQEVYRTLGLFVGKALAQGFQHVDCEAEHIFVEGDLSSPDADGRMYFIDVDGGRLDALPTEAARRKIAFQVFRSLSQEALDRPDKKAFLETFFGKPFSEARLEHFLRRLEAMEAFTQRRKRFLKALRLKRRG